MRCTAAHQKNDFRNVSRFRLGNDFLNFDITYPLPIPTLTIHIILTSQDMYKMCSGRLKKNGNVVNLQEIGKS